MSRADYGYVSTGRGLVVHKLRERAESLLATHRKRTVCGVAINAYLCDSRGVGMGGYSDYDEAGYGFCLNCKRKGGAT